MGVLRHVLPLTKTICFDFDGVVGVPNMSFPKVTRVSFFHIWLINFLRQEGYEIVICTARDDLSPLDWVRDLVPGVEFTNKKPIASIYIDDRGMGCPVCVGKQIDLLRDHFGDRRINQLNYILYVKNNEGFVLADTGKKGKGTMKLAFKSMDGETLVLEYLGQGVKVPRPKELEVGEPASPSQLGISIGCSDGWRTVIKTVGGSEFEIPGTEGQFNRWPMLPEPLGDRTEEEMIKLAGEYEVV